MAPITYSVYRNQLQAMQQRFEQFQTTIYPRFETAYHELSESPRRFFRAGGFLAATLVIRRALSLALTQLRTETDRDAATIHTTLTATLHHERQQCFAFAQQYGSGTDAHVLNMAAVQLFDMTARRLASSLPIKSPQWIDCLLVAQTDLDGRRTSLTPRPAKEFWGSGIGYQIISDPQGTYPPEYQLVHIPSGHLLHDKNTSYLVEAAVQEMVQAIVPLLPSWQYSLAQLVLLPDYGPMIAAATKMQQEIYQKYAAQHVSLMALIQADIAGIKQQFFGDLEDE